MNDVSQQPAPTPCPMCGGERVVTGCDGRMSLIVRAFESVSFNAIACTNCGYTELFAEDPQKLRQLLQ